MEEFYASLLLIQVVFLILCCRKSAVWKWVCQLLFQFGCTLTAASLFFEYEKCPLHDWIASLGIRDGQVLLASWVAMIVFLILLFVGFVFAAFSWAKQRQEENGDA